MWLDVARTSNDFSADDVSSVTSYIVMACRVVTNRVRAYIAVTPYTAMSHAVMAYIVLVYMS